MYKIIILLILFSILCFGCVFTKIETIQSPSTSSSQSVQQTSPKSCWFMQAPPKNSIRYIYGTASGTSQQSADENAKANISKYFRAFLTSRYREHFESNQINDNEQYSQYIENVIIEISQLQIPGTTISERCKIGDNYYSLAKIDKAIFEESQLAINTKIRDYINAANNCSNPGKRLRKLFLAISILPQSVTPFNIEDKVAIVYLQNEVSKIIDSVESSYEIINFGEMSNTKQISIRLLANQRPLTSIPILFDTTSLKCNSAGIYFLDYNDFCDGEPFYLKWQVDYNSLSFPELNEYQQNDAVKLIKNIVGSSNQIYIVPPVELIAQIEVNCFIDDEQSNNIQVVNAIKKILLQNDILIENQLKEPNMKIKADVNIMFSSENEYLGFCYNAAAVITITGAGIDKKVILLDDLKSEESTKSFNKSKRKAAENSLKMMITLIKKELEKYISDF